MDRLTLQTVEKIDVNVDPVKVEDCHWVKTRGSKKKGLSSSSHVKMPTRFVLKEKLKGKNLISLGINTPVCIKDSLFIYYKKLWAKCKKLHRNKLIHAFWTYNASIKLKVSEKSNIHVITHDVDLEELFPGNELIKDKQRI